MSTIPLVDTALISEQEDPYNLVDLVDFDDPVPFHATDTISIGLRTADIPASGDDPDYTAGDMSITYETLSNAIGRQFGRILEWAPNVTFYGPETYRGITLAGDTVKHGNSIYDVVATFTSNSTFSEKDGNDVFLERVTKDTDDQYLELTGSAQAPLLAGATVLRYATIRRFDIFKQYDLPNERLSAGLLQHHRAYCNADITTDLVLTIKKKFDGGSDTIGTITFTAPGTPNANDWVYGLLVFNDLDAGAEAASKLTFDDDHMLVIEATTVPVELTFVTVNLLGLFVNYKSPYYYVAV